MNRATILLALVLLAGCSDKSIPIREELADLRAEISSRDYLVEELRNDVERLNRRLSDEIGVARDARGYAVYRESEWPTDCPKYGWVVMPEYNRIENIKIEFEKGDGE